jgi:hypothetical protein
MSNQSIDQIAAKYKGLPESLVRFAKLQEHDDAHADAVFQKFLAQGFYRCPKTGAAWGEPKAVPPSPNPPTPPEPAPAVEPAQAPST